MTSCPYCGALEAPNNFPSASQRFSVYKYACGTEIVFCGSSEGVVEWKCTDGFRPPPIDFKRLVDTMPEDTRIKLQECIRRLSKR